VLFSMLRRETLVISIFLSLPEKRGGSEVVLPKSRVSFAFQSIYFWTR
jgi:hypothetical protein